MGRDLLLGCFGSLKPIFYEFCCILFRFGVSHQRPKVKNYWDQYRQRFTSSFCEHRSQKHKKQSSWKCLFALLGSGHSKATRKTLVKSSQDLWSEALKHQLLVGQLSFFLERFHVSTVIKIELVDSYWSWLMRLKQICSRTIDKDN